MGDTLALHEIDGGKLYVGALERMCSGTQAK